MKAFIRIGGDDPALAPLSEHLPAPLAPLVDRPFLQHLVEWLVGQGFREFQVFCSEFPEKIETLLGDGTRWGSRITFHLGRNDDDLWQRIRIVAGQQAAGPVLLCPANLLVQTPLAALMKENAEGAVTVLSTGADAGGSSLGWYITGMSCLKQLPAAGDTAVMTARLEGMAAANGCRRHVDTILPWRTFSDILSGQRRLLEGGFPELLCNAREAAPGVRIERNVSIHPTVELVPPLFIGENTQVAEKARLGPNAVISPNCIVDTQASICDSLILSGSYIGETLEISEALVDRNRMINVAIGGSVDVSDDFILGSISGPGLKGWLGRLFWRLAATVLLIVSLPAFTLMFALLTLVRGGKAFSWREGVRIPTERGVESLETFFIPAFRRTHRPPPGGPSLGHLVLEFLPGLLSVIRGDISIVGLPVRSAEEIRQLPADWQALYLKGKAGLISEPLVYLEQDASAEEIFLAETYYMARQGFIYDLKLVSRYMAALFIWSRK